MATVGRTSRTQRGVRFHAATTSAVVLIACGAMTGSASGSGYKLPVNYPAHDGPSAIAAIGLNGDQFRDLVVANETSDDVSVLLSNSDGTYQAPVNYAVGDSPEALLLDDVTGDSVRDIVVVNADSDDLSVLP